MSENREWYVRYRTFGSENLDGHHKTVFAKNALQALDLGLPDDDAFWDEIDLVHVCVVTRVSQEVPVAKAG